jgi:hypothetical protein
VPYLLRFTAACAASFTVSRSRKAAHEKGRLERIP